MSEILDFVAGEILNFNHYSYLTAHLDSVLRSAFNHYSYLTAHLDSVLRSAKFEISLEFRETSVEACTNGQFDLQNSDS